MAAKGTVDYLWCSSLPHTLVYELFTTLSIFPVFLASDFIFHLFEKRERLLYLYDMPVMLLSIFFITAFWRRIPGQWNIWNRAVNMMGNWDDVKLLCGPLLAAAILGYGLYAWTLKGKT
jgi:hypothetical protein